jgi:hypothetical protein
MLKRAIELELWKGRPKWTKPNRRGGRRCGSRGAGQQWRRGAGFWLGLGYDGVEPQITPEEELEQAGFPRRDPDEDDVMRPSYSSIQGGTGRP